MGNPAVFFWPFYALQNADNAPNFIFCFLVLHDLSKNNYLHRIKPKKYAVCIQKACSLVKRRSILRLGESIMFVASVPTERVHGHLCKQSRGDITLIHYIFLRALPLGGCGQALSLTLFLLILPFG